MPTVCPKCKQLVPVQPTCEACGAQLMRQTADGRYELIEPTPSVWQLALEPLLLAFGVLLAGLLIIGLLVWLLL